MSETFKNNIEARCLAETYNLLPPLPVYPARNRATNPGKYEADHFPAAETRCMVLAHFSGGTNIIIQYKPIDLEF